jgi:hypothetical protein
MGRRLSGRISDDGQRRCRRDDRVRAKLAMAEEDPALNLYDGSGRPSVTLRAPTNGPAFALLDDIGNHGASVVVLDSKSTGLHSE